MKKNRIITTSIREIKNSFKRFLSLLIMSMLGVGVFVGIRMAAPDMLSSLDYYYDNANYYDIKILSTLGLTNDDINALSRIDGVKEVYGSYSKDVVVDMGSTEIVIKVIGITDDVNKVDIISGRRPKNNNEIIVEENFLKLEKLKLGDKITLEDEDTFFNRELEIVGTVKSPLYISTMASTTGRGNTNLGSGKINYYTYVNSSNFKLDVYTESYIVVDGSKELITSSDNYVKKVDKVVNNINKIKSEREKNRYEEVYALALDEISKKEKEGLDKFSLAKKELDLAGEKLKSGKNELDKANLELINSKSELDEFKNKLNLAKEELNNAKKELDKGREEIDNGKKLLNEELNKFGMSLDDILLLIDFINSYEFPKDDLINLIPKDLPNYEEVIDAINNGDSLSLDILKDIISIDNIDKIIEIIPSDIPNYEKIIKFLNSYKEDFSNIFLLIESIEKIRLVEEEYNKGLEKYNIGLNEYNEGYLLYLEYLKLYEEGLNKYNDGLKEYNSNFNLYNDKLIEYYNSKNVFDIAISDAKKELEKIEEVKWYIYDRDDDSQYSTYIDDGESVSNLSDVFPTIFFVVAVLISLVSMSRMVEDDRLLIGTLKSLGFSNKDIRKKYILYSGSATILGGIIGALLGYFILPLIVWNIYKILFEVPTFKYYLDFTSIVVGILIALVCICGTTLLTIRKVVREKPSQLLRGKSPEAGKRIVLEKISFIWKRINFSNKITIRNLFRYKKRVLMTIGGIFGCCGLMLAGFGIRDSIVEIPEKQYKDIFTFDEMVYLNKELSNNRIDEIFNEKEIVNKVNTNMISSVNIDNYPINIFVPGNEEELKNILNLRDLKTKKQIKLEDDKVIITDKLAELIGAKVGDKITITDSKNNNFSFEVSSISENYVGHYVFMNKTTYENNIDKYITNVVYVNIDSLDNEEILSKKLLKNDEVIGVLSINSTVSGVKDMLESLNSVVLILIILSGALSFVVLYNLSYINISERKREIATLKVLGFTDREVDNYITKEMIILTIVGIIFGLGFGIVLTNFIITTVEVDMVRFLRNINLSSFIISSCLIMTFTLIVNGIIHFTLKKIDMIESLKSVE